MLDLRFFSQTGSISIACSEDYLEKVSQRLSSLTFDATKVKTATSDKKLYKHQKNLSKSSLNYEPYLDNSIDIEISAGNFEKSNGNDQDVLGKIVKDYQGKDLCWRRIAGPETVSAAVESAKIASSLQVELFSFAELVQIMKQLHGKLLEEHGKEQSAFTISSQISGTPILDSKQKLERIHLLFENDGFELVKIAYRQLVDEEYVFESYSPEYVAELRQKLDASRGIKQPLSPALLVTPGNAHIFDLFILFYHILLARFISGKANLSLLVKPSESDVLFPKLVHDFYEIVAEKQLEKTGLAHLFQIIYFDPHIYPKFVSDIVQVTNAGMYFGRARSFWSSLTSAFSAEIVSDFSKDELRDFKKKLASCKDNLKLLLDSKLLDGKLQNRLADFLSAHHVFHETLNAVCILPNSFRTDGKLDETVVETYAQSFVEQVVSGGAKDCTNINNLLVPLDVYDKFRNAFVKHAKQLVAGSVLDSQVTLPSYATTGPTGLAKTLEILEKRFMTKTDIDLYLRTLLAKHAKSNSEKQARLEHLTFLLEGILEAKAALATKLLQAEHLKKTSYGDWDEHDTLLKNYTDLIHAIENSFPYSEELLSHHERFHVFDSHKEKDKEMTDVVAYGDTFIVRPQVVVEKGVKPAKRTINPKQDFTGLLFTQVASDDLFTQKDYQRHTAQASHLPWVNFIIYDEFSDAKKILTQLNSSFYDRTGFRGLLYVSGVSGPDGKGDAQLQKLKEFVISNKVAFLFKEGTSVLYEYDENLPHMGDYFVNCLVK